MADGEEKKKEPLKIRVWDEVKVRDVIAGMETMRREHKTRFVWLLIIICLLVISSGVGSFLNGWLGFIVSVILGLVGIVLGFHVSETIIELVRVIRQAEEN